MNWDNVLWFDDFHESLQVVVHDHWYVIVAKWNRTKLQTKFPTIAKKLLKAPDPNIISL
jgi:hypothetical protein